MKRATPPPNHRRCIHIDAGKRCKNWNMWEGYCFQHWELEKRLRGAVVLASIVLAVFLCMFPNASKAQEPTAPLTFHLTHDETYPAAYAENLYWASCRQVWMTVRPDKMVEFPPPEIEVRLGAEKEYKFSFTAQVYGDAGSEHRKLVFRIDMPDWKHNDMQVTKSDRFFAVTVVAACEMSLVPYDQMIKLGDTAIITANAKVSVEELLEKRKHHKQ